MGMGTMGNRDGLGADGSIESSSGSKHPVSGCQIRLMARRAKASYGRQSFDQSSQSFRPMPIIQPLISYTQ